jgi:hypothetical protein
MITQILSSDGQVVSFYCSTHDHYIPLDPANRHYQEVLDEIIEQGAACFDGDIPEDLQAAADTKLFNQQLADYTKAVARLAQYQVALGLPELTKEVVVDQQFNEETGEMEDVTETQVTQTAIEPVEPTVEQTVYGDDPEAEPTVETIENPLITQDNAERAAAQAVVDATPQEVKDFS